ncbi:MAG: tetratricopeptide repeat protein, partial [Planctomycetes bacterium]|nr:tetratricopeptide repeat protein [Planctomycetota bacterium]
MTSSTGTVYEGVFTQADDIITAAPLLSVETSLMVSLSSPVKVTSTSAPETGLPQSSYEIRRRSARRGEFDKSIKYYQKVPPLKSSLSVKVYNRIAGILGEQGKLQEEIEFLQKAVQYNAQAEFKVSMGGAHYNLATALKKVGNTKDAAYHFDKAKDEFQLQLQDNPKSAKALTNLGHCFAESGNFEEASN